MIFGTLNPEKIPHKSLRPTDLCTSPVRCSHYLGKSRSHFQQYYSYILPIKYVISEEKKYCNPLKKVFHLTEGLLRSF